MNNRQAGRRRGRGGQRPQGGNPNRPDNGNRIDNRARGNAAQLLEKYKNLARDSQMQGDRVNTEYYHQFADHYFRVLNESRARFEEQNPRRNRDDEEDDGFDYEGDGESGEQARNDQPRNDRPRRDRPREERPREERSRDDRPRDDRPREDRARDDRPREDRPREERAQEDRPREARPRRDENRVQDSEGGNVAPVSQQFEAEATEEAPRRRGRPRRQPVAEQAVSTASGDEAEGIEADRLPPKLSVAPSTDDGEEVAEKPRRRRRVRSEDEATSSAA